MLDTIRSKQSNCLSRNKIVNMLPDNMEIYFNIIVIYSMSIGLYVLKNVIKTR